MVDGFQHARRRAPTGDSHAGGWDDGVAARPAPGRRCRRVDGPPARVVGPGSRPSVRLSGCQEAPAASGSTSVIRPRTLRVSAGASSESEGRRVSSSLTSRLGGTDRTPIRRRLDPRRVNRVTRAYRPSGYPGGRCAVIMPQCAEPAGAPRVAARLGRRSFARTAGCSVSFGSGWAFHRSPSVRMRSRKVVLCRVAVLLQIRKEA